MGKGLLHDLISDGFMKSDNKTLSLEELAFGHLGIFPDLLVGLNHLTEFAGHKPLEGFHISSAVQGKLHLQASASDF
jgi:hypothetical protein